MVLLASPFWLGAELSPVCFIAPLSVLPWTSTPPTTRLPSRPPQRLSTSTRTVTRHRTWLDAVVGERTVGLSRPRRPRRRTSSSHLPLLLALEMEVPTTETHASCPRASTLLARPRRALSTLRPSACPTSGQTRGATAVLSGLAHQNLQTLVLAGRRNRETSVPALSTSTGHLVGVPPAPSSMTSWTTSRTCSPRKAARARAHILATSAGRHRAGFKTMTGISSLNLSLDISPGRQCYESKRVAA